MGVINGAAGALGGFAKSPVKTKKRIIALNDKTCRSIQDLLKA
jgi:hypothetical protein